MKLNSKTVATLRAPGRYADGAGLYLQVTETGVKSWIFRYERAGRERAMGLGPFRDFSLKDARERARRARVMLADGIDPIAAKHAQKAIPHMTFKHVAVEYYKLNEKKWSPKHPFLVSLEQYAFPILGHMDVKAIDMAAVQRVIEPLWHTKTETMRKVRGRIETVLNYAKVKGFRTGDNPARWDGNLSLVLPSPTEIAPVKHLPALPFAETAAFVAALRKLEGLAARALEFTILTAVRTGEALGSKWAEIDFESATWTIPAERTKTHSEHRVPLSAPALALLRALPTEEGNDYLFVGRGAGSRLGERAMSEVVRAVRPGVTVHGFRSTFRDWAAETTGHDNHVVEMALGHKIGNAVEKAYRRGDLFEKRRSLMNDWSRYCAGEAAVVQLRIIAQ